MAIYIYGIVEGVPSLKNGGGGIGGEIYTIQHRDLAAVVNHVPEDHNIPLEEGLTHERVLRRIMDKHTLIPMSFGTVAKNAQELKEIMKRGYMTFKNSIRAIKGTVQANVTASWKEKAVLKEISGGDREIRRLKMSIVKGADEPGLKIKLGKLVKEALDERRKTITHPITSSLQSVSLDFRENIAKDGKSIINISLLLKKDRLQDFNSKLDELEEMYGKEITLTAIGPLPPYNFTDIEIKTVDYNDVKKAKETLGLNEMPSISEIKQAYNNLAQKLHPDLHPKDAENAEHFRRVNKAYEVLIEYCEHRSLPLQRKEVEDVIIVADGHH